MKIAVIGSRNISDVKIESYIPRECTEIISGGAVGVDKCAAEFAESNSIKLTEILPDYKRYGRASPIVRNQEIVDAADVVIAFWDGSSKGTEYVIGYCKKVAKEVRVIRI